MSFCCISIIPKALTILMTESRTKIDDAKRCIIYLISSVFMEGQICPNPLILATKRRSLNTAFL